MKTLDIIIPAYNEELLLKSNVEHLLSYLYQTKLPLTIHIVLAVNGSNDKTPTIAASLAASHPQVKSLIIEEGGKGNAIKKAIVQSDADFVLFMDIDLAVSLEYIPGAIAPLLKAEADLVMASRLLPASRTQRSALRSFTSRIYNELSRIILRHSLNDLQCGFKAGIRTSLMKILPEVKEKGLFFDTELVLFALQRGLKVIEIPVSWQENRYAKRKSKVHFFRDSSNFFFKLFLLRKKLLRRDGSFWKRHYLAILLATVIGGMYGAPHAYFALQPGYQGIYMATATDEDFYMTTINKSYQSSGLVGDPYLFEYQEVRNPFQYYAIEFVLGRIGKLLALRTDQLAIGMKILFPFLITLVLYGFSLLLTGKKGAALFVSAAMMLANEAARPGLTGTLNTLLFKSPWTGFLLYDRPVNPQVSALFFYGALILCFLLLRQRSKLLAFSLGILAGLLAYIYFYFWAFVAVVLVIMLVYGILSRQWALATEVTIAGSIAFVISLPFLMAAFSVLLTHTGGTLAMAVATHAPIVEKMILLPLVLYAGISVLALQRYLPVYVWAGNFMRKYCFVLLLLIAGVIVSNQQVITGKLIQQQHFHFFTNIPIFIFAISILAVELLELFPRKISTTGLLALSVFCFWFAAGEQLGSYKASYESTARFQALAPLYAWLNAHPQAVVLTDAQNSMWLPMYTQDFVYSSPYDATYQVPQERVVHDYFVTLALRGVSGGDVRKYVYEPHNRNEIGYLLFSGLYYRDLCGSAACFPDSVLEDLIVKYQSFSSKPLIASLKEHRVDYMLLDGQSQPAWEIGSLSLGKPVIESGDYKLYAIP